MLVAINDMSITEHITPAFLSQHQDFICNAAVIVVDCNISEAALAWLMENSGATPVFVDPGFSLEVRENQPASGAYSHPETEPA